MNNLEKLSENDIKNYKRMCIGFILVIILAVICIIVYIFCYTLRKNSLLYCQDTGLYRTLKGNKIISYTENLTEDINKNESIRDIGKQVAGNVGIAFLGNTFGKENCTETVLEYVQAYIVLRDKSSEINLSEKFAGCEMESFGFGELTYFPDKIYNGFRYSKGWITESLVKLFSDYKNRIMEISQSEVPKEIQEDFEGEQIIGYIPYEEKLSDCMSDKVYEKDGDYFINVKDLEIEDTYGYVYYFGEQAIDLMSLEPSQELREINPDNRFTWIMQDELTEVKGDWCYVYFKNKHHEELGVVKVKVKDNQAVDIEISGME